MKRIILIHFFFLLQMLTAQQVVDSTKVLGVTITDPWGDRTDLIEALSEHCLKPTGRIVFDEWVAASEYDKVISDLEPYCFIMGEILDSYYVQAYSVQQYLDRTTEYLNRFENEVDIWEIGNEVNGEWLGETDSVIAKIEGAYNIVSDRGRQTALTLYYNKACYENPENEMFTWVNENLPESMKQGLDYVLVSYYEDDCEGVILSQAEWQAVFDSLRQIFPNSKLGMGECGTLIEEKKAEYMSRYYSMEISTPGYIRGYFWWYYQHDCVPKTKALWDTLDTIAGEWLELSAIVENNVSSSPLQLKIYPNPTHGSFSILSDQVLQVEIYNILGQRVMVPDKFRNIDLSDLPKGIYFLHIRMPEGWKNLKLIRY